MSFLKKNNRGKKKNNAITLETPEITDSFLYFLIGTFYYMKKGVGSVPGMLLLSAIFLYIFFRRFLKNNDNETETIGGMEVPKLKDNYDLSLD
jgi:hypothetical protein